jgi:hypothetical protein
VTGRAHSEEVHHTYFAVAALVAEQVFVALASQLHIV